MKEANTGFRLSKLRTRQAWSPLTGSWKLECANFAGTPEMLPSKKEGRRNSGLFVDVVAPKRHSKEPGLCSNREVLFCVWRRMSFWFAIFSPAVGPFIAMDKPLAGLYLNFSVPLGADADARLTTELPRRGWIRNFEGALGQDRTVHHLVGL